MSSFAQDSKLQMNQTGRTSRTGQTASAKKSGTADGLLLPHGGYRKLRTYQLGTLIYDATAAFCRQYLSPRDRTYDQMVQAARSGVANIVEGSMAAATSKKTELKLTNVAKASQEELLFDYQTFLRLRQLPQWDADAPQSMRIRQSQCVSLDKLRSLMASLVSDQSDGADQSEKAAILAEVAANTMLTLINQEIYLLARQLDKLAEQFTQDGGFTERLYHCRKQINKR